MLKKQISTENVLGSTRSIIKKKKRKQTLITPPMEMNLSVRRGVKISLYKKNTDCIKIVQINILFQCTIQYIALFAIQSPDKCIF